MDELVKQVQVLAETVKAMVERQEVAFRTLDAVSSELLKTTQAQREAADHLTLVGEAQEKALSDLDGITDDLAKVTAALLTMQKEQEAEKRGGPDA